MEECAVEIAIDAGKLMTSLKIALRQWITLVASVLLCSALFGCAMPRQRDAENEIRAFVARFVRAVNDANVDDFVACFAPDATAFFPSAANAARRSGRDAIRAAVAPTFAQGRPANVVTPRELTINAHGELAYVTFDGGSGSAHARRTLVLRRQSGAWAIAHLHASNLGNSGG
jgi:uncharacterized protein (TIGR02246 family)